MAASLPPFVKKFDFRGEYGKDITDQDAYYLGLAFKKTFHLTKVLIGWDTRESSKSLAVHFIRALKDADIEICYMDKCPIDYVTASAYAYPFDLSVMFTGSHNPWTWTGLLVHTRRGDSLQGEVVEKVIAHYNECRLEPFEPEEAILDTYTDFTHEAELTYAEKIVTLLPLQEIPAQNVLVDIGDGSGSKSLTLLQKLLPQVTFERLNDRQLYNAETAHTADPSNIENMQELISQMQIGSYSAGFGFDSDADRILAVDERGNYINGSLLGSAHSSCFITRGFHDTKFGYAVDCGLSMKNCITDLRKESQRQIEGKPIPVGRSLVRKKLREGAVDFAAENVGHFYMKDFFMTDSGTFSIAVVLYWMAKNGPLSKLAELYPDGYRGQVFLPVLKEAQIDALVTELVGHFSDHRAEKIDLDGIRYEFYAGKYLTSWFTIRKSGYEPITKCYFGAKDEETYLFLKKTFATLISE